MIFQSFALMGLDGLVRESGLLLMDEPFSALDVRTAEKPGVHGSGYVRELLMTLGLHQE
ncbi:hypothetical protein [Amycolatopsis coloradensis]|uniref:hypothetical protein n=1 Tax=Amycolatopsis coloradensis TaxID=76021 RepID=UPI0013011483|nr:hypothetical protein [Amycolatopsis coloradensis]